MSSKFFQNKSCEFFPCHKLVNEESFNCMFCYCPLYALKENCGGNFSYTEKGIKDCSACLVPHKADNYEYMVEKAKELVELVREKNE